MSELLLQQGPVCLYRLLLYVTKQAPPKKKNSHSAGLTQDRYIFLIFMLHILMYSIAFIHWVSLLRFIKKKR